MLVEFRNNWFGPDGQLYKASRGVQEVADGLKDQLPRSAKVWSAEEVAKKPKK